AKPRHAPVLQRGRYRGQGEGAKAAERQALSAGHHGSTSAGPPGVVYAPAVSSSASAASAANRLSAACSAGTSGTAAGSTTEGSPASSSAASGRLSLALGCVSVWTAALTARARLVYRVQGPVMIFLTTTAIEVDEELLTRCLVLTVDEGREQTRAIHERQRLLQTIEGLLAKQERGRVLSLHQNA